MEAVPLSVCTSLLYIELTVKCIIKCIPNSTLTWEKVERVLLE